MDDGKALSFRPGLSRQAGTEAAAAPVELRHRTPSDAAPQVNSRLTPASALSVDPAIEPTNSPQCSGRANRSVRPRASAAAKMPQHFCLLAWVSHNRRVPVSALRAAPPEHASPRADPLTARGSPRRSSQESLGLARPRSTARAITAKQKALIPLAVGWVSSKSGRGTCCGSEGVMAGLSRPSTCSTRQSEGKKAARMQSFVLASFITDREDVGLVIEPARHGWPGQARP
jgi:hypothetical protein